MGDVIYGQPLGNFREKVHCIVVLISKVNLFPKIHFCQAKKFRALVSTGATGAVAPELFEEHIGQKQIFCDISKILLVQK